MPAYQRVGGEWIESIPRVRANSAWSGDADEFNVRDASDWKLIWPYGDSTLNPPTNLEADASHNAVTLTWTDPAQTVIPTNTQIRIPEITTVWTEYVYGTEASAWSALDPSSTYQAQVRYVKRSTVDGTIELTSGIATAFFTTAALSGPGTPAPDPGGSGPDATIPWSTTPGGTPGPVDSAFCWWEYVVQQFDVDTYIWSDSAVDGEFAGDAGSIELDFIDLGFDCGETLRFKYREVCNSVPEDYEFGLAFTVVCDYNDPCGGINQTMRFDRPLWTDALFAMPKICYEDFTTKIEDYIVDGVEYGRMPAFLTPLYLEQSWNLVARGDVAIAGEPLAAGHVSALVPLGSSVPALTSDASFMFKLRMAEQPNNGGVNPMTIASFGDTVRFVVYSEGAGFRISVFFAKQGGGQFSLNGSTELALDELHSIAVTIDQDGNKILYVNGDAEVTVIDATRADFSAVTGNVKLYANSNMRIADVGGWDRVLTVNEVREILALQVAILALTPKLYLPLSESSGTFVDLSANGNDGTAGGTIAYATVAGEDGAAYPQFNSGWIDCGNDATLTANGSGLSFFALMRLTTYTATARIMGRYQDTSNLQWLFSTVSATALNVTVYKNSLDARFISYSSAYVVDEWVAVGGAVPDFIGGGAEPQLFVGTAGTPAGSASGTIASGGVAKFVIGALGNVSHTERLPNGSSLAHVALLPGVITQGQFDALVAAAQADGWTV